MAKRKFFIVDTMAMVFRSYHAFAGRKLATSAGTPTSAIFGSLLFLQKLIKEGRPHYIVAATDCREKTFRHHLYDQYKANRTKMPEDLSPQIPLIYQLMAALKVPVLKEPGLEADDLIGSLIRQYKQDESLEFHIISGDKDFIQLIDERTFLMKPRKGGLFERVDVDTIRKEMNIAPHQFADILAIMGDSSDNVPGVRGIGDKGALKLVQDFGNLQMVFDNIEKINNPKQRALLSAQREMAELSKRLVTIKTDHPISSNLEDFICCPDGFASKEFLDLARQWEFRAFTRQGVLPAEPVATATVRTEDQGPAADDFGNSDHRYRLINSASALSHLVTHLEQCDSFAFDTETTGLDTLVDQPIGISFSTDAGRAFYVPLKTCNGTNFLEVEDIRAALQPVFKSATKLKIAHNLKFDLAMLENFGIEVKGPFFDTMIASYLLEPNSRQHGLDYCALKFFNYRKISIKTLLGTTQTDSMLEVELAKLSDYACEDADFTYRLYDALLPMLKNAGLDKVFFEVEMPLIPVLHGMERAGVFIDTDYLAGFSEELAAKAAELETKIFELAGIEFNIQSPSQLGDVLFEKLKIHEKLGIKKIKKTKSGYSTDVSVLETMADDPIVQLVLEYRSVAKLRNTYVDNLPKLVCDATKRVHTQFHQAAVATGRLSSTSPNLQNIPIRSELGRKIRSAFRSQKEGYAIVSADYSQIELRLLAHLASEPTLREDFKNGRDIHRSTASKIFGIEESAVTKDHRTQAKAINFGIIYGMGPMKLARETNTSLKDAKDFIGRYFDSYPQIKDYIHSRISEAESKEYTETILGRRRPLPEIRSQNQMIKAAARNIAINSPVQGSAADLIKCAMIKVDARLKEKELDARMLLQVHDELLFECHKDHLDEAMQIIRTAMEEAIHLPEVPLLVDIGVGANWLEAH
jgi:DNA polymerase-1